MPRSGQRVHGWSLLPFECPAAIIHPVARCELVTQELVQISRRKLARELVRLHLLDGTLLGKGCLLEAGRGWLGEQMELRPKECGMGACGRSYGAPFVTRLPPHLQMGARASSAPCFLRTSSVTSLST